MSSRPLALRLGQAQARATALTVPLYGEAFADGPIAGGGFGMQ